MTKTALILLLLALTACQGKSPTEPKPYVNPILAALPPQNAPSQGPGTVPTLPNLNPTPTPTPRQQ